MAARDPAATMFPQTETPQWEFRDVIYWLENITE